MLENSALAGVISSVEILSPPFKLTGTFKVAVQEPPDWQELNVWSTDDLYLLCLLFRKRFDDQVVINPYSSFHVLLPEYVSCPLKCLRCGKEVPIIAVRWAALSEAYQVDLLHFGFPARPLKLRLEVRTAMPSVAGVWPMAQHGPQAISRIRTPASISIQCSRLPSAPCRSVWKQWHRCYYIIIDFMTIKYQSCLCNICITCVGTLPINTLLHWEFSTSDRGFTLSGWCGQATNGRKELRSRSMTSSYSASLIWKKLSVLIFSSLRLHKLAYLLICRENGSGCPSSAPMLVIDCSLRHLQSGSARTKHIRIHFQGRL